MHCKAEQTPIRSASKRTSYRAYCISVHIAAILFRETMTRRKPLRVPIFPSKQALVPVERIERAILQIRDKKVILDADLASLYGVETRVLIQAVKRNLERFPEDFMFQLTQDEFVHLRSQIVTSREWGGRRYPPYAFTEQGVAMLSSVLRSPRAIQVNIEIMRAFVRLRKMLASHAELARRLDALEKKYDSQFKVVFDAIRQLMAPPEPKRRPIGFRKGENKEST